MRSFLTRRDFLERAALTSAVLASARPAAAADGQRAPAAGRMFVSLNGSVTRGVAGFDKARLAAKAGYGGVDWDLGPAKAAGLDATKSLFAELKIEPTITSLPMARPLPFGGEQAAFRQALGQLAEDAAFAAAKAYAQARALKLGQAVSELILRGSAEKLPIKQEKGVWIFDLPSDTPRVTARQVQQMLDESA